MKGLGAFIAMLGLATLLFAIQPTDVAAVDLLSEPCTQANTTVCGGGDDSKGMVTNLINALLTVLGAIAVIVIVVGGIKYTTSDGDASKIKNAKDTILYAIVGLIIAMLSYAIVNFIVGRF